MLFPGQAEARGGPVIATSNSPSALSSLAGSGPAVSRGPATSWTTNSEPSDPCRMSSSRVGSAVGRLAGARVGDLRVGAEPSLVAQAGDVAGEAVAVVAVGDRCAHRGVGGVGA